MNLATCYNAYKGSSLDVDGVPADAGQCVQWADTVLNRVYELPYFFAPGAIDWWNSPSGSLDAFEEITDGSIKVGDFVIYDQRVGSSFGHIDVAASDGSTKSYVGYDSNWGNVNDPSTGLPILHTVTHNDQFNNYILGSLRLKGADMPPFNDGDRENINKYFYGADLGHFAGGVGQDWKDAMYWGVFETVDFKTAALVNTGDVPALNAATGRADGNTMVGKPWKDVFYLYLAPNMKPQFVAVTEQLYTPASAAPQS